MLNNYVQRNAHKFNKNMLSLPEFQSPRTQRAGRVHPLRPVSRCSQSRQSTPPLSLQYTDVQAK